MYFLDTDKHMLTYENTLALSQANRMCLYPTLHYNKQFWEELFAYFPFTTFEYLL
jgi:hypothetical protein